MAIKVKPLPENRILANHRRQGEYLQTVRQGNRPCGNCDNREAATAQVRVDPKLGIRREVV
jgi:hypothetical protein